MNQWNCYLCIIELARDIQVSVCGKTIKINPGTYIYVGSSRRPGLALARILRHLSRVKRIHWHIDYITTNEYSNIIGFILVRSSVEDCEKQLTDLLLKNQFPFIKGFGASDKHVEPSHLFKCSLVEDECIEHLYDLLEKVEGIEEVVYVEVDGEKSDT